MLLTPHILIGGAIGKTVGSVPIAFVLGFISHFVFDAIPHFDSALWRAPNEEKWNRYDWITVGFDLIFSASILAWLYFNHFLTLPVLAGMLGGATPDLLDNVPFWKYRFRATKFGKKFNNFHDLIHHFKLTKRYMVVGFLLALVASLLSIAIIIA